MLLKKVLLLREPSQQPVGTLISYKVVIVIIATCVEQFWTCSQTTPTIWTIHAQKPIINGSNWCDDNEVHFTNVYLSNYRRDGFVHNKNSSNFKNLYRQPLRGWRVESHLILIPLNTTVIIIILRKFILYPALKPVTNFRYLKISIELNYFYIIFNDSYF